VPSWPSLCLVAVFSVTVWPHVLLGTPHSEGDEKSSYYPTVRAMAEDWPRVSPYDVPTMNAVGPLYLYLLSALPTPVVQSLTAVKLVSSLLSLALILVVYHYVAAACRDRWVAFGLTLPVLCCQSFQLSAIWLLTDNAALLFLVPALFDPLLRSRPSVPAALATTFCATLATATRQIYAWVSVPLAGFYLIRVPFGTWRPSAEGGAAKSFAYLVPAALAVVGPLGVLGLLVHRWGGLVPPGRQAMHSGSNLGAAPFALGLLGAYALAYAPAVRPDWRVLARSQLTAVAAATGLLLGLVPDSFNDAAGRSQGLLWRFVQLAPAVRERSLLLLVLAPVGALTLAYFYLKAREQGDGRGVGLLYLGLFVWLLAQVSNPFGYQRYYEVFLLTCLAVLAARYGRWGGVARWGWLGPAAAALFTLTLSHLRFLELI
jgi:hypothetical protein